MQGYFCALGTNSIGDTNTNPYRMGLLVDYGIGGHGRNGGLYISGVHNLMALRQLVVARVVELTRHHRQIQAGGVDHLRHGNLRHGRMQLASVDGRSVLRHRVVIVCVF